MNVTYAQQQGVGVIALEGSLTSQCTDEVRSGFVKWYRQQKSPHVVVDLRGVEFMDSTGLGVLMACLKTVGERKGKLALAGLQARPRMVIEITRAHRVFDIYGTADAALAAMTAGTGTTGE